jgi:hypothetical protein
VSLEDQRHYMAALGADYPGPFGLQWREGKVRPWRAARFVGREERLPAKRRPVPAQRLIETNELTRPAAGTHGHGPGRWPVSARSGESLTAPGAHGPLPPLTHVLGEQR